jgi:hypothetical protein
MQPGLRQLMVMHREGPAPFHEWQDLQRHVVRTHCHRFASAQEAGRFLGKPRLPGYVARVVHGVLPLLPRADQHDIASLHAHAHALRRRSALQHGGSDGGPCL